MNKENKLPPIPLTKGDDPISRMERAMGCRFEENDMDNPTITALMGMAGRIMNGDGNSNPDRDDFARGIVIREDDKRDPAMDMLALAFAMMDKK